MAEMESQNKSESEQVVKDSAALMKQITTLKQKYEASNSKLKDLETEISKERAARKAAGKELLCFCGLHMICITTLQMPLSVKRKRNCALR